MSNKSPIFPMPESHHFNDYGFDPQIHFSQVLEQSRNHTTDSLHFNLHKPISKHDQYSNKTNHQKAKIKKYLWWRNAVSFFNWKKRTPNANNDQADADRAKPKALRGSISGPVYMIETSRSGSTTPGRISSRSSSGISTPYHNLRELNMEEQQPHRVSTSSLPIYLVI